ncbi:DUF2726 domain-containing protein [Roseateles oligotrophus]|uniref:DUF2726 domain-containing protein n=1 Tax=Roseateles oligotrophus TaxID=1769250 RepID=A0ABT2YET9_9BURK|nr:DUF2726 domain-containing protein [Roseateles oligotrophus]MCV2368561.1 DUF2726 domain-containing protein [Roseateles oligotrophus]
MQITIPWIVALMTGSSLLALAAAWALRRPSGASNKPLPTEWALTARPVFNADERRVYRLLKEALPHHVILAKLPMVRFCQPTEAQEVRYWFELLGAIHVTFAICSPNGRVLAAVDLDSERGISGRSLQIKQSVLGACRVRYLRCPIDKLPSAAELQLLVPFSNNSSRGPQPAPTPSKATSSRSAINGATPRRSGLMTPHKSSNNAAAVKVGRHGLWQDSAVFHDSFFAPDSRFDTAAGQDLPRMARSNSAGAHNAAPFGEPLGTESRYPDEAPNDIVGLVVDSPRYGGRLPR